jgi:predicted porin
MQKKLIALAVASALSAPAFADNANVTFYGKLIADVESVKSDKSTLAPFTAPATGASYTANRVVSDASRFGLKGDDDLGEGLKAIFQIETQVELVGNNSTFTSVRNTGVGLKSDAWGSVMVANWDTPFKLSHNKVELFDNTTFASATNLIGRSATVNNAVTGVNTTAASDSFVTRKAGVVQYYSPKMGGFDVKVAFAPASDTYAIANNAATKQNQSLFSLSGTFETEALYVAAAYESHGDALTPTATRGTGSNTAARVVGAYTIGGLMLGATVERLSISQQSVASATSVEKNSRTGYELMASYKTGPHNFGVSYAKQGKLGPALNTGAKQVSARYGFDFSKRTQGFLIYSQLSNETAGLYALSAGQTITSAAGAKYSGFGAGLQYVF